MAYPRPRTKKRSEQDRKKARRIEIEALEDKFFNILDRLSPEEQEVLKAFKSTYMTLISLGMKGFNSKTQKQYEDFRQQMLDKYEGV